MVIVDADDVDVVSGIAWELGVGGIEEHVRPDTQVELRIGCEAERAQLVLDALSSKWSPIAESVAADEGLDAWREYAQSWRVGNMVIVPPWLETPLELVDNDQVFFIDPGHAFGSASHETTRMCLAVLAELVVPGCSVADIGCGSGVLAIVAAHVGASRVIATDIAAEAIVSSLENVRRNEVEDIVEVSTATVEEFAHASFDLVVANIGAATLCAMANELVRITKLGGVLVLSGILDEQVGTVRSAFEQAGTECSEIRAEGEWRTLVMTRPR